MYALNQSAPGKTVGLFGQSTDQGLSQVLLLIHCWLLAKSPASLNLKFV